MAVIQGSSNVGAAFAQAARLMAEKERWQQEEERKRREAEQAALMKKADIDALAEIVRRENATQQAFSAIGGATERTSSWLQGLSPEQRAKVPLEAYDIPTKMATPTGTIDVMNPPNTEQDMALLAARSPDMVKNYQDALKRPADLRSTEASTVKTGVDTDISRMNLADKQRVDEVRNATGDELGALVDTDIAPANARAAKLVRAYIDAGDIDAAKDIAEKALDWEQQMRRAEYQARITAAQLKNKEDVRKDLPLYRQFSQSERDKVENTNKTINLLKNVEKEVGKLDPGKLTGFVRYLQTGDEKFMTPELKGLNSRYTMLTQSLTKQIQGSRPSDYDAKIFERATGQGAMSKENMLAALGAIGQTAIDDANNFARTAALGYGIEEDRIRELYDPDVWTYGQQGGDTGAGEADARTVSQQYLEEIRKRRQQQRQ